MNLIQRVCDRIHFRKPDSVRVLSYNTMLLPICPESKVHPGKFQHERLADMFILEFQ